MYWKQDILDTYPWIKYGMAEEKQRDFIKKTSNSYLNPDAS